ncbi:MAG: carboxylating nicotinate-nucleotide diphosphorylase [Parvularculaceae bacterium]
MINLPPFIIEEAVKRALEEDLGLAGDITSAACVPADAMSKAILSARRPGVIAGVDLALAAFRLVERDIEVRVEKADRAHVGAKDVIMRVEGPSRGILSAERVALNFLGRLSGVATQTALYVEAAAGTRAKIVCTRKTTPGLRAFEKYAVLCGGGRNHRFGLSDAVMIKDNHIVAAGGIAPALRAAKDAVGHMAAIEIEVETLEQMEEALEHGARIILLDNMSLDDLRLAVTLNKGRAVLEASGGVTLDSVKAIAATGVDVISSGAITHSAPCLDLGLDFLD